MKGLGIKNWSWALTQSEKKRKKVARERKKARREAAHIRLQKELGKAERKARLAKLTPEEKTERIAKKLAKWQAKWLRRIKRKSEGISKE